MRGSRPVGAARPSADRNKRIATDGEVRTALDGDAVLFFEESEIVFKEEGLETFHEREDALQDKPLPAGPGRPYEDFLKALAEM